MCLILARPPVESDDAAEAAARQGRTRQRIHLDCEEARGRSGGGWVLTYRSGAGTPEERTAGTMWLRPTFGPVDPDRVLVCPGAQSALTAILGALAERGDAVLTDVRGAAAQLGVRLIGIAADREGLLPDAIEQACRGFDRRRCTACLRSTTQPPLPCRSTAAGHCGCRATGEPAHP